jgi:hypothetical protein
MAARFHRLLKVVAFNANGIATARQCYELREHLQELHTDVALLSEIHLKPNERFFIPNYHIYRTDRFPGRKGGNFFAVRKGIPHSHAYLPPLASVEATGVCIPIDNSEILLAVSYKSPCRTWTDEDIIELLSFRHKSILGGDLSVKHPFWNSALSNPTDEKLLGLYDAHKIEISAPQCPTY